MLEKTKKIIKNPEDNTFVQNLISSYRKRVTEVLKYDLSGFYIYITDKSLIFMVDH